MMLELTPAIRLRDGSFLADADWMDRTAELLANRQLNPRDLQLRIYVQAVGQPLQVFEDDLEPLLQQFCLQTALALRAGQDGSFRYFSYPAEVSYHQHDGLVTFSGTLLQPADYPTAELCDRLRHSARRLLDWLHGLKALSPLYDSRSLDSFEQRYAELSAAGGA